MVTLRVNGTTCEVDAEPNTPLLWVLRDDLRLTGTKYGCGVAQCGACTVHIDGRAVRSCVTPASAAQGREVTTIEGVSGRVAKAVRDSWRSLDVVQCGYCQSGQIMSAIALLAELPNPSDDDIDAAMTGNVCRCATYVRIRAAIKDAARLGLGTGSRPRAGSREPGGPGRADQSLGGHRRGLPRELKRGSHGRRIALREPALLECDPCCGRDSAFAMDIRDGIVDSIGNTPLIRLRRASELTGCTILGKAEFLNPGGSVKDRAALAIIADAEAKGLIRPGGVIVEGTAGNTGIGLTLVGNARGYRTVIVLPETQSQEKKDMLRLVGAELREVPAVPYANPGNYVHVSERVAGELAASEPNGAFWANQWDNLANRHGHYATTGPEIWRQTDGRVDGFVCAIGTGGTLSGVGMFLKERNPAIRIALADPMGAAMYSWFKHGVLKAEGSSITEGIGQGRITGNVEGTPIDVPYQIPDEEALPIIFELLKDEGLCLGGSSGINVAGAIRLARELGPGHVVVTVLADYGNRYQSKLFNPAFLRSKNLPVPDWLT